MMASTTTNALELLAASAPLLARLARLWWNPATADSVADLAQDIAVRVLTRLHKYDPATWRSGWEAWVRVNAKTVALTARRERGSASRRPVFAAQFADLGDDHTAGEFVPDHREPGNTDPAADDPEPIDRVPMTRSVKYRDWSGFGQYLRREGWVEMHPGHRPRVGPESRSAAG
jgi:DNA-directed RNA polymerase specialized sigma24 family protein